MKQMLVTIGLSEEQKAELSRAAADYAIVYSTPKEVTEDAVAASEVIFGTVPPAYLAKADSLRLLQLDSAGCNQYVNAGTVPEQTLFCSATGAFGEAISEFMIAEILFLFKSLDRYCAQQAERKWKNLNRVRMIRGSRVLAVGAGNIGSTFARKMNALGATVVGVRRHRSEAPDYLEKVCTFDELDAELPLADVVACALPETPSTHGLFDGARIGRMKNTAVFVNFGRGTLVDQEALAKALKDGRIGGACLDVTDPEPLPSDSGLWDAPNLILTPHASGGNVFPPIVDEMFRIFLHNFDVCQNGGEPISEVDREAGYRKYRDE